MMPVKDILISGGDIAGTTSVFWLLRFGLAPTISEPNNSFRDGDYIVDFWDVGDDVAETVSLLDRLEALEYPAALKRAVGNRVVARGRMRVEVAPLLSTQAGRQYSMNWLTAALRGRWIFLVEDVFPVLLMLEGTVHAFDCHVAARPETLADARRQAHILNFDAALPDIHVWGETIYAVADILRERETPFASATGQDVRQVSREWRNYPIIGKPHRTSAVGRALAAVLRSQNAPH